MNLEQYLSLLQAASSDEERAAITAEMSISQLPEPTQTVARQAGLLAWFNEPVVAALLAADEGHNEALPAAKDVLAAIAALPFVETVDWGYQFHTTTAAGWRQKYEQPPFAFVIETHRAATAGYLTHEEDNTEAAIRAVCSQLLSQQYEVAYERAEKLLLQMASANDWESLLTLFAEMAAAGEKSWTTPPPYPAFFWFATAFAHGELNEYEQAIADYDQAIALNPEYATAFYNRGNAYRNLKEHEKAIADYDQAIALNPEYATAFYNRGNAYRDLKEHEKAIADYDQAIALNPEDASAFYNRGNAYIDLNEYEQAIADYDQAIALNPEDATAFYNRGNAYRDLKEHEKAIADYDQAIALNPEDASAYNNRGIAYRNLKEHEKAIADYDQAIALNPEYASAYFNLGHLYSVNGRYDEAIVIYQKALGYFPNDAHFYNALGSVYDNLKQFDKAIREYEQALTINPKLPYAHNNLASVYQQQGEYEKAIIHYRERVRLQPDTALAALVNLGTLSRHMGKPDSNDYFEQALAIWDKAWQARLQTESGLLGLRATALLCLGKTKAALQTMREAIEKRLPADSFETDDLDLLAQAPNPPAGLEEIKKLIEAV